VREAGEEGRIFLQVHLLALPDGRFRIRHRDDREAPTEMLRSLTDPYAAREIAQTTAEGAHRPLKTAADLRSGWSFESVDERGLWIALDYLYPACAVHWHAGRTGGLRVTSWGSTAARQSGMYSSVRLVPADVIPDVVRACCTQELCLRRVAWGLSDAQPAPLEGAREDSGEQRHPDGAEVPCPEACSMFISFARSVLKVEREPRREVPGLGTLNQTEIQQIRELVQAAAEGREAPRDGEFDDPLNRRRIRYLAQRLGCAANEPPSTE
jgi:hypothetical protein